MSLRYKGDKHYLVSHPLAGPGDGETYGAAIIPGPTAADLKIIFSSGMENSDWEHVSVSCRNRCPNWVEMCFVKELFWDGEDCVVQFHPPKSDYVKLHDFVLHMWRATGQAFPIPPKVYV